MKKNLVLTGMMGVGKSTIGRSLSKKLNMRFVDLDRLIELKFNYKNIFMKNFYKVTILFVWKVDNDNINKKFYKDGILFFAEYNDRLLEF